MTIQDPKVVELSFRVMESILKKVDFNDKQKLLDMAKEMRDEANAGDYPEEIKLAYVEAINKIDGLSLEQLKELRDIISD